MKTIKYAVYFLLAVFLFIGITNSVFAAARGGGEKPEEQEFSISSKGKVKITGAVVQDIAANKDKITIRIWGMDVLLNITNSTKLVRKFRGKSGMDEFTVGDNVNVSGNFVSGSPLTINGLEIRDKSIHKIDGKKDGTVQSVSGAGFIFKTDQGTELTVKIMSDTEIMAGKITKGLSDIKVGDKVIVSGIINTQNNTILAARIKIKTEAERVRVSKIAKTGNIESINTDEKSFVLRPETGDNFTVKTTSDTDIRRGSARKQFSYLKVGDKVSVKGTKDAADSVVINAARVKIITDSPRADISSGEPNNRPSPVPDSTITIPEHIAPLGP